MNRTKWRWQLRRECREVGEGHLGSRGAAIWQRVGGNPEKNQAHQIWLRSGETMENAARSPRVVKVGRIRLAHRLREWNRRVNSGSNNTPCRQGSTKLPRNL